MNEPTRWTNFDLFLSTAEDEPPLLDSERFVSYSLEDLYPEWHRSAHCRDTGLSNYFGNEEEQPTMSIKQVRNASKLCDVCPVFTECLTHALTQREEYGVWAATSGRTRRRMFTMIDSGVVDVEHVVEDWKNGRREQYTAGPLRGNRGGASPDEGGSSLRAQADRDAAI